MVAYIAPQVRNITKLFRQADAETIQAGADWYQDAYEVAEALAKANNVSVDIVAGILAALSPLNAWGHNVNLAARFLAEGGLHAGYLKANLAKARDILAGAPIIPTLSGEKVTNFYLSIITKGAQGVCIDRHAYSLAVNTRFPEGDIPTLKGKRYAEVRDAYVRAARILSREYDIPLTPAQVQSVTWVVWRRKFWSEGAFDGHNVTV